MLKQYKKKPKSIFYLISHMKKISFCRHNIPVDIIFYVVKGVLATATTSGMAACLQFD